MIQIRFAREVKWNAWMHDIAVSMDYSDLSADNFIAGFKAEYTNIYR